MSSNSDLRAMGAVLERNRLEISEIAHRIIHENVVYRYPLGGARLAALTQEWSQPLGGGVWMRSVDTASDAMSVVLKSAEVGCGIPAHTHEQEEFLVVLEGRVRVTVGGAARTLAKNDTLLIPPHVEHAVLFVHPSTLLTRFEPRHAVHVMSE